jgi:hypothetical protein
VSKEEPAFCVKDAEGRVLARRKLAIAPAIAPAMGIGARPA